MLTVYGHRLVDEGLPVRGLDIRISVKILNVQHQSSHSNQNSEVYRLKNRVFPPPSGMVGIQMGFHIKGEIREYEQENEKKARKFEGKRKGEKKVLRAR